MLVSHLLCSGTQWHGTMGWQNAFLWWSNFFASSANIVLPIITLWCWPGNWLSRSCNRTFFPVRCLPGLVFAFNLLKVTPDLRGCSSRVLREKIHMRGILKESTANYVLLESLINVDFGKKYELAVFKFHKTKLRKWPPKWPCVIHLNKWINRVPKFGRFLWNLAWTFLRCCETKCVGDFWNL